MTNKYDEVLESSPDTPESSDYSDWAYIHSDKIKKALTLAANLEEYKEALRELVDAGKHLHADTYEIIEGGVHSKGDFIAGKILGHCQNVREENLQMICRLANTCPILKTLLEEMNDE